MPKYIKAEPGPGNSVIYTDSDGLRWQFEGGNRPWRNHNPGNLVVGNVSKRNGAIGKAGGFAVFPDYESGHRALLDSLRNSHGEKDISRLMRVYAPPRENQTRKYIAFIRKITGVKGSKKIRTFTAAEFEKLWQAIERMEGWGAAKSKGTVKPYVGKKEITGIRKDKKGTIRSYKIEGIGWVSKKQGIELATQGEIRAVVATSPRGNKFLRSPPNRDRLDNLESKG